MIPKSLEELTSDILERLEEHTPFTNVAAGGRARALADLIIAKIAELYEDLDDLQRSAFVSTARNVFLDLHGELVGVRRLPGESDPNYLYRITHALDAVGGRREAVRLAALSVPLVRQVEIKPYTHGSGSFSLIVVPHAMEQLEEAVSLVEEAVAPVVAEGIRAVVRGPHVKEVKLKLVLSFKETVPDEAKRSLRQQVKRAVKAYIDGLDMGRAMLVAGLIHAAMSVSKDIQNVIIMEMHVGGQPLLVRDVPAFWDEKFYVRHIDDIAIV